MIKRIYFLTSEIVPFAETYSLATFSKEIPIVFNERKYDFRLMMPKYNFISERRYILREVIRLREMDLLYKNQPVKAAVKSAFIPNTKVQVYFLEHNLYFNLPDNNLYHNEPSNAEQSNAARFGYFATAALVTLNYLRWKPEVIICNDWQMSLIPLLINSGQLNPDYLDGVKILQIVHSKSEHALYHRSEYEAIGINNLNTASTNNETIDCLAAALPFCHHTLFINHKENIWNAFQQDAHFTEILKRDKKKYSIYNLTSHEPEDWQKLADEIIALMERM